MPPTFIFTVSQQLRILKDVIYIDVRPGLQGREVRRNLLSAKLPPRQYKMFQALAANFPTPLTHWELFYHVWGEGTHDSDGRPTVFGEDGGPLVANSCVEQIAVRLKAKLAPLGLTIHAPRKGYGYEIKTIEEVTGIADRLQEIKEAHKAPAQDSSGQEAEGEVRGKATHEDVVVVRAPRNSRGSKALQPVHPQVPDHPSGITLTIEPVRVRR